MDGKKSSVTDRAAQLPPTGSLELRMTIGSDPRLLSVVRSAISELAAISGFEDDQCRVIALAIDEALCNVIGHAYKGRCDQEIELNCRVLPDCLDFAFVDHGEPADLSKVCAQPLDGVSPGGRGTHLIRQIMDEVRYERVPEGNRLLLKKYLPGFKSKV